jgi:hypothetical protein
VDGVELHEQIAHARVEQMLGAGIGFAEIETFIEADVDLPGDAKSALWLLAWAERNGQERRGAVEKLLAGVVIDRG